ncbi:hypothetical protein B484DRAFT_368727 [Ochromonadaceae sp. CCMP2298]|nr:hypothetical protein B484DRAFT_368727 [Ochromonadaceae sp. CCMP2298]
MYLPASEPLVRTALREVFTSLRPLLVATVGEEGMLHELSSLVADPGAPRQCVHADTIDQSMEPMYTFFVALQDVTFEMGHTVFLPRTHTPAAHLMWNVQQSQKERFLTSLPATSSGLKKGDVAIFDSRVLHCGSANTSDKRRVLFYLTLSRQQRWPLPGGQHGSNSVRVEDRYMHQVKDFL